MSYPIVAIIGRPNVGKSTLFNRLVQKRIAIVDDWPGVTRDRNYAFTSWQGKGFYLVDTGGFVPTTKNQMERLVKAQAEAAMEEADLILLVLDAQTGITELDLQISKVLKKIQKKIILVANKVDNEKKASEVFTLVKLGLGEPSPVSAALGLSIGELLDEIVKFLPDKEIPRETESIKIAVIGRPNVGKSSFVNALLGKEKLIVSEIPGTTRDSIDSAIEFDGQSYSLIDTAGLKRRAKVSDEIEYYTSLRTLRSIQRCDVALLLVEAPLGLVMQDLKIAQEVIEQWKGLAILVNKWDLLEKDAKTLDEYAKLIQRKAAFLKFAPVIFISAKTKQRLTTSLKVATSIYEERKKRIETSVLNELIRKEIGKRPPGAEKGKYIKIFYCTQTGIEPPTFVFFCNYPEFLKKSYLNFLENRIRENFGFMGTPLRIKVRKRE
jgi:GTP-binding protein